MSIINLSNDDIKLRDTEISYEYNLKFKGLAASISRYLKEGDIINFISSESYEDVELIPVYDDHNKLCSPKDVICVKYNNKYILVQLKEADNSRKAYKIAGQIIYARVAYLEKVNDKFRITTLY